jgi:hypothetical protein
LPEMVTVVMAASVGCSVGVLGASPGVVTPRAGESRAERKGAAGVHFTLARSAHLLVITNARGRTC